MKKPGPRCSSDTLAALQKTSMTYAREKAKADQAYEELSAMPLSYFDYDDKDNSIYYGLVEKGNALRKLSEAKDDANLNYDSSPEGIKSIEALISTAGESYKTEEVLVEMDHKDDTYNYASDPDSPFISMTVKTPNKAILQNRLNAAQNHREWQSKIAKSLFSLEGRAPEQALFVAKGMLVDLESTKNKLAVEKTKNHSNMRAGIISVNQNPSDENVARVHKLNIEQDRITREQKFLAIKMKDMTSYISDIETKSEPNKQLAMASVS